MKRFRFALVIILSCILLASCSTPKPVTEPEPPVIESTKAHPELFIAYRLASIEPPLTTFNGKAYLYPRPEYQKEKDGTFLFSLNTLTNKAESEPKAVSDYLYDNWFFTTDAYLYRMSSSIARSSFDGSDEVAIPQWSEYGVGMKFIASDDEGNIYLLHTTDESACLVKYDFEAGRTQELWETATSHTKYDLVAVSGQSFIIREGRRTDTNYSDDLFTDNQNARYEYKFLQYTLGQQGTELTEYAGTLLPEIYGKKDDSIEFWSMDPYTNTLYYSPDKPYCLTDKTGRVTVVAIDIDNDIQSTISFDSDALAPDVGSYGSNINQWFDPVPEAATKDGFIVQIGSFSLPDRATSGIYAYGYISRDDYAKGVFNVTPFDYSVMLES